MDWTTANASFPFLRRGREEGRSLSHLRSVGLELASRPADQPSKTWSYDSVGTSSKFVRRIGKEGVHRRNPESLLFI